jgi:hypothetical protein
MGLNQFKATVTAAQFPFSYHQASRSVLQATDDIAPRTSVNFVGSPDSYDYNLIQLLLAENVIPIAKGLQTVTFEQQWPAASPVATDFDQLILINNPNGTQAQFCPARGKNYILTLDTPTWTSHDPFVLGVGLSLVSKAYINGRTLIFYERTKCIEWNTATNSFDTLTLNLPAGFVMSDIRGNCAASNYHILFTAGAVLWSTPLDVLEFDDAVQGSGNQIPVDLHGEITCCVPIPGGFLICSTQNIIAASFTNDASRPFAYREVMNSAGIVSLEQITEDANTGGHFGFGAGGLQQITLQRAESVFPEASDFLVGNEQESWDTTTKSVITTMRAPNLTCKLKMLGNRYLAISYGATEGVYDFVLMYDIALKRWGKLKITHVDCDALPLGQFGRFLAYYEWEGTYDADPVITYDGLYTDTTTVMLLRRDFGFLQADGTVLIMTNDNRDGSASADQSVAVFGRIQQRRNNFVTVQLAEMDGLAPVTAPVLTLLGSTTGYDRTSQVTMVLKQQQNNYAEYNARYTVKNADLAIEGSFQLTNLILGVTNHGSR